jgi:hypothetical protein
LNFIARSIFNRRTKNALKKPTYRTFQDSVHSVIHKLCGQFFHVRLPAAGAVKAIYLLITLLAALIDAG